MEGAVGLTSVTVRVESTAQRETNSGTSRGLTKSGITTKAVSPELDEIVKSARSVVSPEHKHRILVDARHVTEALVWRVA